MPAAESQRVLSEYLRQRARGKKFAAEDFETTLTTWLIDLSHPVKVNQRKSKYREASEYWTIPSYALAHRTHPKTACKWFRELEKVAKQLYPQRVPTHRKSSTLTAARIRAIRAEFAESGDFKAVAAKFDIAPFRVGQLCAEEKAKRQQASS
jgi:hypothetical protein